MKKSFRIILFIAALIIGILLWGFYIIQEEFAKYGMYQLISYRIHELSSFIPLLCTVVSIGCVLYLLVCLIRKNSNIPEKILLVIFILCLIMQFSYFKNRSDAVYMSGIYIVKGINQSEETIVICTEDNNDTILLNCPMLVQGLLVEEQKYLISFQTHKRLPKEGELHMISLIK